MILKSKRSVEKEGISVNQLYPVIEYRESIKSGRKAFRIYDDSKSLSWKSINNFYMKSDDLNRYSKDTYIDTIHYIYISLDPKLFDEFYFKDEQSKISIIKLEEVAIDILSDELLIEDIIVNINELGFKNENIDTQLKVFFNKASKQEIINFIKNIYDNIMEINEYLLQIIVNNIILYNDPQVENLLVEIYMNSFCSKEVKSTIDKYWS